MPQPKDKRRAERNDETLKYATNYGSIYTKDDVLEIRQMAGSVKSDEIAIELGRSLRGVTWKAQSLGIPMPDVAGDTAMYRGQRYPLETLVDAVSHRAALLEEDPSLTVAVIKAGQDFITVVQTEEK